MDYHSGREEWKKLSRVRKPTSGARSSRRITFIDILVITLFLSLIYPLAISYSYIRAQGGYRFHLKIQDLDQEIMAILEVKKKGNKKEKGLSSEPGIISVRFLLDGEKSPLLEDLLPLEDDIRIIRSYFPGNLTGNLQCFIQFEEQEIVLRRPVHP